MKRYLFTMTLATLTGLACFTPATGANPAAHSAQDVLDQAASNQKYTFLIFYKEDTTTVRAMAQVATEGVTKRQDQATLAYVQLNNPAEKSLVDHFGAGRAPMPLLVAVAPNGAITAVHPYKVTDKQVEESIVTPAMAGCLKLLQEEKLVFVCVSAKSRAATPPAVQGFQADPEFQKRIGVIAVEAADPGAAQLLQRFDVDPAKVDNSLTLFLAPPGILVGRFAFDAPKDQLAAALHKADKCCEPPNCKHGKQAQQPTNTKRN